MNCALITTLLIDKTSVVIIMMRLMLRDHNMCVYVCVCACVRVYSMYHSVPGVWCRQWCNASRSCPPEQRLLSLAPPLPSKDKPAPSFCPHLCTSTPCPLQAGPGSCGWLTAGLWSSSPDWPGSPRQTCTSAAPARSTPARRRSSPRTRTAGRCSPPEQSLRPDPGRSAGLCRRGGSPSARTSASDRKSWSHPVCVCVCDSCVLLTAVQTPCVLNFLHNWFEETGNPVGGEMSQRFWKLNLKTV